MTGKSGAFDLLATCAAREDDGFSISTLGASGEFMREAGEALLAHERRG